MRGDVGSASAPAESFGRAMGGRSLRRSSNVVLSESRRFCSAALCEVLRMWMGGGGPRLLLLPLLLPAAAAVLPREAVAGMGNARGVLGDDVFLEEGSVMLPAI